MREFDKDGLTLCKLQGNLFEESKDKTSTSSDIFIRRFMNSSIVSEFDTLAILDDTKTNDEIFDIVEDEFGESTYGTTKYDKEPLYWMGYLYRYFSYTYELTSKQVYKIVKPTELNEMYYVYHTFDCSTAIERILEEKGLSFDINRQNEKLLQAIRKQHYEENISLSPMTKEDAHNLFSDFENDKSLFEQAEDYKEYIYDYDVVDNYISKQLKKGYILLSIIYKNDVIGEIRFKGIEDSCSEIGIVLKNDRYKNKGIGTIALSKALDYAKDILKLNKVVAKILKTNKRSQHIFEKIGFVFYDEDEHFDKFYKNI